MFDMERREFISLLGWQQRGRSRRKRSDSERPPAR